MAEAVSATPPATEVAMVRAGGGVVWRSGPGGGVEVVLVHRPRYDDWSLPKGKCEAGESYADCARREVEEETGLRCRLGPELGTSRYIDHKGRPKEVRWWVMTVLSGAFVPNVEVDELQWLPVDQAEELLTYDHDRDILAAFAARSA